MIFELVKTENKATNISHMFSNESKVVHIIKQCFKLILFFHHTVYEESELSRLTRNERYSILFIGIFDPL